MSFFLNKREKAHRDLGHWHFDPSLKNQDFLPVPGKLSPELCQKIIDLGQELWDQRTAFTSGLYLVPDPDPEVMIDKQEISERFLGKIIDFDREWFNIIYLDLQDDVANDVMQQIQNQLGINITSQTATHALKKNLSGVRLAVQRPGCITMNHIDHVYGHTPNRPGRFDEPWERKIVIFLQDHVPGQYFNIGNHNFHPWLQGEAFSWNWGVPHHACNFSSEIRYNLMVSIDPRLNPHLGHTTW